MNRTQGLILGLLATLTVAACASGGSAGAQTATPSAVAVTAAAADTAGKQYPPGLAKPSETEFTRKGDIALVKAQATKEPAAAKTSFLAAAQAAEEGLQQDSLNPKLWLIAGQGYAGAGEMEKADRAFDRALEIYPAYEPNIEAERESAWIAAFNKGVQEMQAGENDAAIADLESAQAIYQKRPEGLLNLAILYIRKSEPQKAADTYQKVLDLVHSPLRSQLPAEATADWDKYEKMARSNTAQLYAQAGVAAFQDKNYDEATKDFENALEINKYYRDALQNLAQVLYIRTNELEPKLDSVSGAAKQQLTQQLNQLYDRYRGVAERAYEMDPYNNNVLLLLARAYRGLGVTAPDQAQTKQWQDKALDILRKQQALPFQISNFQVAMADSAINLKGQIENLNMDEGKAITLKFTMLDENGQGVGTQQVTVNAPPKNQAAPFEVQVPISESVLGWKYELVQ